MSNTFPSSGNVGIGTISPTQALEVAGNTQLDQDLNITGNLSVSGTSTLTGNVGVGVSPQSNLAIYTASSISGGSAGIYEASAWTATGTSQEGRSIYAGGGSIVAGAYIDLSYFTIQVATPSVSGTLGTSYQLYINAAASATTRYGMYQIGTDQNYLAGALEVVGAVKFDAGQTVKVSSISSNTILDATYCALLVDTSSGSITVTLPSASANSGQVYRIKNIAQYAVQVVLSGSDTIDGKSSLTLNENDAATIISNGSGWFIF